uniref:Large ribosomal subunit protein uL23c n=1 Tax=Discoplastis spathirhyncha TaxID=215771 RepID=A0A3G3LLB7_9EUGL|nr:ribosomal protein L23 [Discoplastis spathirhyncha]AYQ93505.1 ribosomal protein L23 [Discoplastis spathirhyncha]
MIDLVFKNPVFTDKTIRLLEDNKYVFSVDVKITKKQVKLLIEDLFLVKVSSINSYIFAGKKRRLGKFQGYKNVEKRIIITLKTGYFFPFFSKL